MANNLICLGPADTGNSGAVTGAEVFKSVYGNWTHCNILSCVCGGKSCVPIYAWTDISKKFWEEECTLSFTKWQVSVTYASAGITGWQIQSCSPFTSFMTPNPADLRERGT